MKHVAVFRIVSRRGVSVYFWRVREELEGIRLRAYMRWVWYPSIEATGSIVTVV